MGLDNPLHIAFLLVILLLVFGAKRLPELGRSLGTGMRSFKESISGESHITEHVEETATAPSSPVSTNPGTTHVSTLPAGTAVSVIASEPHAEHSVIRPVA